MSEITRYLSRRMRPHRVPVSVLIFVILLSTLSLVQGTQPANQAPWSVVDLAWAAGGGPDWWGYTYTDSAEAGGPTYNFEDISGSGTSIILGDNEVKSIPIGFTFNYYNTNYTTVYVSSNGFLQVLSGGGAGCCTGDPFPSTADPNGVIAGWWADLYGTEEGGGQIYYETLGTAPNRYLIVQFTNVGHCCLDSHPSTFQWKLYEGSNEIEVHYQTIDTNGDTHSAGIENQDGTIGLQYYRGGGIIDNGTAVLYEPCTDAKDTDDDGWCPTGDCDDGDDTIHPGATETWYDGVDQDCDGASDYDQDADTYDSDAFGGTDCNDSDALIHPGADEIPDDGIDQDCNGFDGAYCHVDADKDGYGTDQGTIVLAGDGSCDTAQGESVTADDCNDGDDTINPGVAEVCHDGIDNNCDGNKDEGCTIVFLPIVLRTVAAEKISQQASNPWLMIRQLLLYLFSEFW